MPWVILLLSGICEAIWAIALAKSDGFRRLLPSIVFVIFTVLSLVGLAAAMRHIPTGTAYAVWTAIGASLTVLYAMLTGEEKADLVRIVLLMSLVACVIGLKLVS